MILVKENIIQLAHIDHFAALPEPVEVPFLRLAQLIKIGGIQHRKRTSQLSESQRRLIVAYEN
jgi:hypothetical protein